MSQPIGESVSSRGVDLAIRELASGWDSEISTLFDDEQELSCSVIRDREDIRDQLFADFDESLLDGLLAV